MFFSFGVPTAALRIRITSKAGAEYRPLPARLGMVTGTVVKCNVLLDAAAWDVLVI